MHFNSQGISAAHVFKDITQELIRARNKFPSNEDLLTALSEEVGELAKALMEHKHEPEKGVTHQDIYKEAIQVITVAIRIASEGDPNFKYCPNVGYIGAKHELK